MISTHGVKEDKPLYISKMLTRIWRVRSKLRYQKGETLDAFHERLSNCFDMGSFMAAQVVADAKYAGVMRLAPDWDTFAASGPGSRRGLNRVLESPVNDVWEEQEWRSCLKRLRNNLMPLLYEYSLPDLHAQDLQNCLCEFDKYERVRLGEGKPRSRYNGGI
jgi:hypothetical protein